jgi:hypothetical protein
MKRLEREDRTYKLDELPALKSFEFSYKAVIAYTGSIVRRPLKRGGPFSHYGFVYGFGEDNTFYIIENNENGVECVTWRDFLSQGNDFEFMHYEFNPDRHEEILRRAQSRAHLRYEAGHNNCEHFVNYCVNEKNESMQANAVKGLTDAVMSLFEIQIVTHPDKHYRELIHGWNELRQKMKLERAPDFQSLVDKQMKR